MPFRLMAQDEFTVEGMNFSFGRGKNNKITGFSLSTGRAAGIVFSKKS